MKNGAVIVDVAIDQGGCVETARLTTHASPTYVVEGVVHYCVTNMPGAVGRTSTIALCNATLPYAIKLANKGYVQAASEDPGFAEGIEMVDGRVTHREWRRRSKGTTAASHPGRGPRRGGYQTSRSPVTTSERGTNADDAAFCLV